jgi:hypothetical protein
LKGAAKQSNPAAAADHPLASSLPQQTNCCVLQLGREVRRRRRGWEEEEVAWLSKKSLSSQSLEAFHAPSTFCVNKIFNKY